MTQPKILIVDDEPFNVDYLEQELEELELLTIAAINGQEALEKVQSEAPDLILLDIMMPVMDGFEVLSRLKANPETRDIPVIVISASSDLTQRGEGHPARRRGLPAQAFRAQPCCTPASHPAWRRSACTTWSNAT